MRLTDEEWSVISSLSDVDNDDERSSTSSEDVTANPVTPESFFQLPTLFYGRRNEEEEEEDYDITPAFGSIAIENSGLEASTQVNQSMQGDQDQPSEIRHLEVTEQTIAHAKNVHLSNANGFDENTTTPTTPSNDSDSETTASTSNSELDSTLKRNTSPVKKFKASTSFKWSLCTLATILILLSLGSLGSLRLMGTDEVVSTQRWNFGCGDLKYRSTSWDFTNFDTWKPRRRHRRPTYFWCASTQSNIELLRKQGQRMREQIVRLKSNNAQMISYIRKHGNKGAQHALAIEREIIKNGCKLVENMSMKTAIITKEVSRNGRIFVARLCTLSDEFARRSFGKTWSQIIEDSVVHVKSYSNRVAPRFSVASEKLAKEVSLCYNKLWLQLSRMSEPQFFHNLRMSFDHKRAIYNAHNTATAVVSTFNQGFRLGPEGRAALQKIHYSVNSVSTFVVNSVDYLKEVFLLYMNAAKIHVRIYGGRLMEQMTKCGEYLSGRNFQEDIKDWLRKHEAEVAVLDRATLQVIEYAGTLVNDAASTAMSFLDTTVKVGFVITYMSAIGAKRAVELVARKVM